MGQAKANRDKRRLLRQFAAIERLAPATRGPLRPLLDPRWVLIRVPVAILLIIVGMQFITIGLLGELVVRTYYEVQKKPIYMVRETLG